MHALYSGLMLLKCVEWYGKLTLCHSFALFRRHKLKHLDKNGLIEVFISFINHKDPKSSSNSLILKMSEKTGQTKNSPDYNWVRWINRAFLRELPLRTEPPENIQTVRDYKIYKPYYTLIYFIWWPKWSIWKFSWPIRG